MLGWLPWHNSNGVFVNRFSHVSPVLAHLHWLPGSFWARFKVLVLTYKALTGLRSHYLSESFPTSAHPTWSSQALLPLVAMLREVKKVSTRSRAFLVVSPSLLNRLEIQEPPLYPTKMKKMLKRELFKEAFLKAFPKVGKDGMWLGCMMRRPHQTLWSWNGLNFGWVVSFTYST